MTAVLPNPNQKEKKKMVIYMFAAILAALFMAGVMINDKLFLNAGENSVLSNPM